MIFENYNKLKSQHLDKQGKIKLFEKEIYSLTLHHYQKSKGYKKILDFLEYKLTNRKLDKIPFLPSKIFKDHDLMSIPTTKIHRVLTSSGTSGNMPSKIYLDKENSQIGFVIPDGLNLEERRKFFAARAVSENLQKVCSVTATEYVKVL